MDDVSGNKAFGKSLNSKFLNKQIPIPVPPLDIQNKIIEKTEKLDQQYKTSRMKFEDYKDKIKAIFKKLGVISGDI